MNQNTRYETLVAEILQAIVTQDGYENIRVEHDVRITGRSGAKHQIDVFWEFKVAGTIYRTCVECKNLQTSIKKTHVAAFAEILRDIDANGIIATTNAFQKGAKQLASFNNIRLVLVNYVVKTIHITTQPRVRDFTNCKIQFNENEIKNLMKLNDLVSFEFEGAYIDEATKLYDANGLISTTLESLIDKQKLIDGTNIINASGLYWKDNIGLLPLEFFEFQMRYIQLPATEQLIEIDSDNKAIFEDIVSNNIHLLKDDGSVARAM